MSYPFEIDVASSEPPGNMLWVLRQMGHILILPTMMGIAEIVDFCDFLSPTPEEQAAPMQLCILFLMLSSTYGLPAGQKFLGRLGQGFIHQQVILIFDVDNGPKAAEFIKEAVLKWPQLRPLCLILKVFLQQRDLNEV
ncbi:hypothetical protein PVK06_019376 [Gossypium arboreum]|uniref:Uncharacterized protein n=1 Tax=Gossypium arboreum TaxID=29729 RepID=A0ABR0PK68_GOSAR|nr:hypothetical protein PVK06_019376 [Gossypium arboreum]